MRRALLLVLIGGLGIPVATASPCLAVGEGAHQARIVIEQAEDTATFCLSFSEDAITGLDALERTGVPLQVQDWGGGQTTVCRIGGVGCDHPGEACWCECPGTGSCVFWGYYRARGTDPWRFSELGPAETLVRDGDLEGWRYGEQTSRGGNAPRSRDGRCVRAAAFLAVDVASPRSGSPATLAAGIAGLAAVGGLLVVRARRRRRPA